jgi:hypothetical protein
MHSVIHDIRKHSVLVLTKVLYMPAYPFFPHVLAHDLLLPNPVRDRKHL